MDDGTNYTDNYIKASDMIYNSNNPYFYGENKNRWAKIYNGLEWGNIPGTLRGETYSSAAAFRSDLNGADGRGAAFDRTVHLKSYIQSILSIDRQNSSVKVVQEQRAFNGQNNSLVGDVYFIDIIPDSGQFPKWAVIIGADVNIDAETIQISTDWVSIEEVFNRIKKLFCSFVNG